MCVVSIPLRTMALPLKKKPSPPNWWLCTNVNDECGYVCWWWYYIQFISENRLQLFIVSLLPWTVTYKVAFFVPWWLKKTTSSHYLNICAYWSHTCEKQTNKLEGGPEHCSRIKEIKLEIFFLTCMDHITVVPKYTVGICLWGFGCGRRNPVKYILPSLQHRKAFLLGLSAVTYELSSSVPY